MSSLTPHTPSSCTIHPPIHPPTHRPPLLSTSVFFFFSSWMYECMSDNSSRSMWVTAKGFRGARAAADGGRGGGEMSICLVRPILSVYQICWCQTPGTQKKEAMPKSLSCEHLTLLLLPLCARMCPLHCQPLQSHWGVGIIFTSNKRLVRTIQIFWWFSFHTPEFFKFQQKKQLCSFAKSCPQRPAWTEPFSFSRKFWTLLMSAPPPIHKSEEKPTANA